MRQENTISRDRVRKQERQKGRGEQFNVSAFTSGTHPPISHRPTHTISPHTQRPAFPGFLGREQLSEYSRPRCEPSSCSLYKAGARPKRPDGAVSSYRAAAAAAVTSWTEEVLPGVLGAALLGAILGRIDHSLPGAGSPDTHAYWPYGKASLGNIPLKDTTDMIF